LKDLRIFLKSSLNPLIRVKTFIAIPPQYFEPFLV
jgi:hypothetical protein